ncbi:sulfite exporter TauE/SafE family protein [Brevibacillus ginsengisoli]|uniref:sulfite exporter TauE/SafE family protein n=1 Tax=Brevibacillus ginsengisoli TaxID=363854 RepID=UPI003CEBCB29
MNFGEIALLMAIGLTGSFFSGLLGIGGAIINFPMLLFFPLWFGFTPFTSQEVSSISMFQVFFASLSGVLAYRKAKIEEDQPSNSLIWLMGIPLMLGSLAGGLISHYVSGEAINVVYGILALLALLFMLKPAKANDVGELSPVQINKPLAITLTSLIGLVAGIVGAGGAFLLVPVMLAVFKIPTRKVISSSLSIVFLSAIGGVIGKIIAGHIPLLPTLIVVIGSLVGAPLGALVSQKLDVSVLRYLLAVLIGLTALKIWLSILL